jgi:hypothetical protein
MGECRWHWVPCVCGCHATEVQGWFEILCQPAAMSLHTQKHKTKNNMGASRGVKGTCECVSLFNSGTHVCTHMGPCVRRPWCRQVQAHAHQRALLVRGLAPVFEKLFAAFYVVFHSFYRFFCISIVVKGAQSSTCRDVGSIIIALDV